MSKKRKKKTQNIIELLSSSKIIDDSACMYASWGKETTFTLSPKYNFWAFFKNVDIS